MARIVLLHGAATTAAIWDGFADLLPGHEVVALERPRTGSLDLELEWLAPRCEGALVVGQSGGATLGLALAASGVPLAGAVLHEPAVGSLVPGLLTPMREAFAAGGTEAFGRALYGPLWSLAMAGGFSDEVTERELGMFAGFEPSVPSDVAGRVITTVGGESPAVRHEVARVLGERFGVEVVGLPGVGHFVAAEGPKRMSAVLPLRTI